MLVHKASGGVLHEVWDGLCVSKNGVTCYPMLRNLTCQRLGLDSSQWWEVSDSSALARRILRCYPCFDPVEDAAGRLVDIVRWQTLGKSQPMDTPDWEEPPRRRSGRQLKRKTIW